MITIKARFDGEKIVLPPDLSNMAPGEVIVVFDPPPSPDEEREFWARIQQETLVKAWDNDEDSVYDSL
jgi:hypothetical protein